MFPLERNKVTYGETDIGHILDQFKLPLFQRTKNELHVDDIYNGMKNYFEVHKDVMCTGILSFATYQSEWMLLDGQHRVRALQKLAIDYPEIRMITIHTVIYSISSEEQMETLYRMINETRKVEVFRSSVALRVWPRVEEWFISKFSSYWKDSTKPVLLNVNRDQVRKRMETEGWLERSVEEVSTALESLLLFYKNQSLDTWISWGYHLDAKRLELLKKDGFYFGIFRHYEWVSRLFSPYGEHFSIETKRKTIPSQLRKAVWNKRVSNNNFNSCYCCSTVINPLDGFHCGHIVAVHNGGKNELSNLEVVCEKCNLDMSTMNMEQYKTFFIQ
jgi:hypothetical protein